jgi:protein O-mannosyl-transferase
MSRKSKKDRSLEHRDTQRPSAAFSGAMDRRAGHTIDLEFLVFAAALVLAVLLVYQPAWQGGSVWDDNAHMTRPALRSWHGLYRIWFELGATQQYYPLLHSAFWLEHKLWGDATPGYHLVNILLHAMAAVMVALLLRRLAIPGAYLAAAIFALHPVHVESVAWITELKNTLSAVFYLGAALVYLRFDQTRKTSLYWWALGLFVLGLLSKTVTATLPAALLVVFWWQRGGLSWRRDVAPLLPFLGIGAVAGLFTAWVERKLLGAEGAAFDLTIIERCLIAGRAIWFYLGKLVWPAELIFIYPRWHVSQAIWWQYVFPLAALLLLAVVWGLRRRAPLAGLLFFVGTLLPVLGFCNVYPFIFSFVADHFQYLASLGIITLASAGAALLLERWRLWGRPAAYCLCGIPLVILATLTWRQSRLYTDIETLYRTTIARNPDCLMAHYNLGVVLAGRGQVEAAIAQYQQALAIKPDCVDAHYNLGTVLARRGEVEAAIAQYQKALEIKPDHAEAHYNLGVNLARRGQVEAAIAHYEQALAIKPDYANAHNNLGAILAGRGQVEAAIAQYEQALAIEPDHANAHNNLGLALAGRGEVEAAIAHFQMAMAIKPDYADARRNCDVALAQRRSILQGLAERRELIRSRPSDVDLLNDTAWILATNPNASVRDGAAAVALAQRAAQLSGGREPAILDTLAAAYAEAGRFAQAVETAQKAIELATQQNKKALANSVQAKLRLYEAGTPFRQSQASPAKSSIQP